MDCNIFIDFLGISYHVAVRYFPAIKISSHFPTLLNMRSKSLKYVNLSSNLKKLLFHGNGGKLLNPQYGSVRQIFIVSC